VTAVIVHLDADAFFASVEQAADVRLRGKPVAVGGSKRGVVASASYEASGDFERYEKFSRFMFSYAYDHTPVVEVASIDEGYFDLKGNRKHSAREVARAHSNRHPAEPENLRLRRHRPKQTGQRRGQQTKETILLHRDPGWPRARVPVSSGK
jgi:nucleotidyltransferase/DNA polymerase involved in DNA repair